MNISSLLSAPRPAPDTEAALLFGLSAYALFFFWRKAAARWANWFPAVHKAIDKYSSTEEYRLARQANSCPDEFALRNRAVNYQQYTRTGLSLLS